MNTQVYFNDGCIKQKDYLYIASKLYAVDSDSYDFSRMFIFKYGQWSHHNLDWNVRSVCYLPATDSAYALSDQGWVSEGNKHGFTQEKIYDAGTYHDHELGVVKQIKGIAGQLYVCGDQGQVYKKLSNGWQHIDDGILDRKISVDALDLNSIDGSSDSDIYVAGQRGRICHFNGSVWNELDSPTNQHLERVLSISKDEIYFCGKNGVLLKKYKDTFIDYTSSEVTIDFWGITIFQEKIYLAALDGIYLLNDQTINKLDLGLGEIDAYRLDANHEILWSFGVNDLLYFDGTKWERLLHPDNP